MISFVKKIINTFWVTCNDHKVKLLHIRHPRVSAYFKSYDGQSKCMYFLIEDDNLLEKYKTIWDKVNTGMKKNLIASLSLIKTFWKPK